MYFNLVPSAPKFFDFTIYQRHVLSQKYIVILCQLFFPTQMQ